MATYKIEINQELPGATLLNGDNALLIEAQDATDARAMVVALTGNHEAAGAWANESLVLIPSDDVGPLANPKRAAVQSHVLTISVAGADTNVTFVETGVAGDTYSDLLDKMVIRLNAHADIAGAAWSSPTFTFSDIADDIGDHTLTATWLLDGTEVAAAAIGSITDGGIAGATLEIEMGTGVTVPSAQFYQS